MIFSLIIVRKYIRKYDWILNRQNVKTIQLRFEKKNKLQKIQTPITLDDNCMYPFVILCNSLII